MLSVDGTYPGWASGLTGIDWLILATLFIDTFFNFFRFLPLLSGISTGPAELASTSSVTCKGICSIGVSTPIVSENEPLFLRSLLGRTATVFHTIGGRHNIQGCYVDAILNELRGEKKASQLEEKKRVHIWTAWMIFLTDLANLDRLTLENNSVYEVYDADDETDQSMILLKTLTFRQQSLILPDTVKDEDKYSRLRKDNPLHHVVTRSLFLSHTVAVQYEVDTTAIQFAGVQKVHLPEVSKYVDTNAASRVNESTPFESPTDLQNRSGTKASIPDFEANISDILPLICFIDGWLEEIKNKDFIIPYQTNKT
jgi:hypothetical protein